MKILKHLVLFIILMICNNAFAQKQNNQWRFGKPEHMEEQKRKLNKGVTVLMEKLSAMP